ncbi:MAG: hypothetical protein U1F43_05390 [Myxococcota bacterium]
MLMSIELTSLLGHRRAPTNPRRGGLAERPVTPVLFLATSPTDDGDTLFSGYLMCLQRVGGEETVADVRKLFETRRGRSRRDDIIIEAEPSTAA